MPIIRKTNDTERVDIHFQSEPQSKIAGLHAIQMDVHQQKHINLLSLKKSSVLLGTQAILLENGDSELSIFFNLSY